MSYRVLVSCPQMQRGMGGFAGRFAERGVAYEAPSIVQTLSEEDLVGMIGRFDGVIAGDDPFTSRVLEHATRLRIISKWGVGIDNIDLEAAQARGIRVTNTPGQFGGEVADVAMGYVILLARRLHWIDRRVREGAWAKHEGTSLAGKTLGVVGTGAIGRSIVRRALGFDMTVLGHDVSAEALTAAEAAGARAASLADLLARADFVVLAAPLTRSNRHMIGAPELARLKPTAYLVNVARGPLVDEAALVAALSAGRLAGAALDVFEVEPLPEESPLRRFEQVVLGSHNGSNTREGVERVNELAVRNLFQGLGVAR